MFLLIVSVNTDLCTSIGNIIGTVINIFFLFIFQKVYVKVCLTIIKILYLYLSLCRFELLYWVVLRLWMIRMRPHNKFFNGTASFSFHQENFWRSCLKRGTYQNRDNSQKMSTVNNTNECFFTKKVISTHYK